MTPPEFVVTDTNTCRHCSKPIEFRQALGWIHVVGLFMCKTDERRRPPYLCAEPVDA